MRCDALGPIPVLVLVRELGIGGTERQAVETARFLDRKYFSPHVGCFRPDGFRRADLERARIPILHLPVTSFRSPGVLSAASMLVNYLRRNRIKIVHAFDAPLNIFSVPVSKFAGVPAVLSSQRGDRDITGQVTKRLLRISDRLTDAVVVNCDAMRRYLIEEEGVPATKIRLCYNAIDAKEYSRRAVPSRWPGKTTIGVICALRREKCVDTLLRSFARLSREHCFLLVVGSGPEEGQLKSLAAELGLGANCHFEPATSDVAAWLSQIDIFVLPSRTEALSNSLMEAMACQCCVVASRVGGNPELVDDGISGLLFEAENVAELAHKLATLLDDPDRREAMAAAAAVRMASEFTYSRAAETMRKIYESSLFR